MADTRYVQLKAQLKTTGGTILRGRPLEWGYKVKETGAEVILGKPETDSLGNVAGSVPVEIGSTYLFFIKFAGGEGYAPAHTVCEIVPNLDPAPATEKETELMEQLSEVRQREEQKDWLLKERRNESLEDKGVIQVQDRIIEFLMDDNNRRVGGRHFSRAD